MKHSNPNALRTKVTLLLVSTLTVMSGATIAPALPTMQSQYADIPNIDLWVSLVLTIPSLLIVIGAPFAGQLVDRLGRKPILIVSLALYGLAGGSGFILKPLAAILCGRALLGLANAGVMISATTLIADYYIGAARATFMGLQAAFKGLGGVIFISAGGILAQQQWRSPFLLYLIAWVFLPMALLAIYEPSRQQLIPLLPHHQQTPASHTTSAFPRKLLIGVSVTALITQLIFYLIPVHLPFYLQQINSTNATQSGFAIAFCTLFSAMSSILYGKLKQRFDFSQILMFSFALLSLGNWGIGFSHRYPQILGSLVLVGIGFGILMPNLILWVSSSVTEQRRGQALAQVTSFMFLGQFLSPIASQPIIHPIGLSHTYHLAGGLLMVLSIVLWLQQRWLKRHPQTSTQSYISGQPLQ